MSERTFNLEAAKKGAVIKDNQGNLYQFVSHRPDANNFHRVILISSGYIHMCAEDGNCGVDIGLYTDPLTVTKYIIYYVDGDVVELYHDRLYDTLGIAQDIKDNACTSIALKILPVTFEL